MNKIDLKQTYLNFFEEKGHKIIYRNNGATANK